MDSTEDIASLLLALHDSTPRTHLPVSGQPTASTSQLPSSSFQSDQPLLPSGAPPPEHVKVEPLFQPHPLSTRSPGHQLSSSLGPASSPGGHLQNNANRDPIEINTSFHIRTKSPSTTLQNLPPPPVIHPAIPSPPAIVESTSSSIFPTPDTDSKPTAPVKALSPLVPLDAISGPAAAAPTARGTKRKRGTGSKADTKAKSKSALVSAEPLKVNAQSDAHVLHPDAGIIRCICGIIDDDGFTIQCDHCYAWEHAVCMGIQEGNVPDEYLCELCLPRAIDFHGAKEKQRAKKEELTLRAEIEAAKAVTHPRKTSGPIGSTLTTGEKSSHQASHSKNKKSNHLIREVLHPPSKDSQPLSINTSSLSDSISATNGHIVLSMDTLPEPHISTSSQTSSTNQRAHSNLHLSLSSIQQQSLATTNPPSPQPGSTNSAVVTQDEDEKFEPWTMEYFPVRENVVRDPIVMNKLHILQNVWDRRLGGLVGPSLLSSLTKLNSEVESSREAESPTGNQVESHEGDEDMKDRSSPVVSVTSTTNQSAKSPVPVPIQVPPEYEPSFSTLGNFLPPVLLSAPNLASVSSKLQIKSLPANAPSNPPQQSFTLSHPSITTSLLRPVYTRPNAYAVFAEGLIPQGTLVGELNGELVQGEKYRQDPINQYRFLGCPKPGVRTLGPGVDLVLDSRGFGNQLRFIRSSCHPNAVLRPMLFFRNPSSTARDASVPPADLSPSDSNPPSTHSGTAGELLFGVFASKDISKREEITLPWEWDDGHVVHALQKLLDSKFSGPFHHSLFGPSSAATPIASHNPQTPTPTSGSRRNSLYPVDEIPSLAELVPKLSIVLIHLTGTFATCACLKKKDCVLSQMARLVEGKPFWGLVEKTVGQGRGGRRPKRPDLGPLIGPVRGWRNREMERRAERERLIEAQTQALTQASEEVDEAEIVKSPERSDQVSGEVESATEADDEQENKELGVEDEVEVEMETAADVQPQQISPRPERNLSPIKPVTKVFSGSSQDEEEDKMDVDEPVGQGLAHESVRESPSTTVSSPSKPLFATINPSPVAGPPSSTSLLNTAQSKHPHSESSQRHSSPTKSSRSLPASSPAIIKPRRSASDVEPTADEDAGNFSDASTLTEPLSNYDSDSASDDAGTYSSPSSIIESDSEEDDGDEDEEETQEGRPRPGVAHTSKAVLYSSDELSSPGPPSSPTTSPPALSAPMTPLKLAPVGRRRFPTRVESESPSSSPPDTNKTSVEGKVGDEGGSNSANSIQSKKEKDEDDSMSSHPSLSSIALQSPPPQTTTTTVMPFPPSPPPAHLDPWISLSLVDDVNRSAEKAIPTGPRSLVGPPHLTSAKDSTPLLPPSPSPPPKEPTPPPPKPPTPPPVKRMSLKDWSKRKKAAAPLPVTDRTVDADESTHDLYQPQQPHSSSPKKTSESISVSQLPVSASSLDTPDDLIYPPSSPDENSVAINARVGAVKDASRPPTPSSEDEPIPGFTPRQSRVQQSSLTSMNVEYTKMPPPSPFLATSSEIKTQNSSNEPPSTVFTDPLMSQKMETSCSLPNAWQHRKHESVDVEFTEHRSITPPPSMMLLSSPRTRQSSMTHMSDPYARSPSPTGTTSPSTTPPLPYRQLISTPRSSDPPKGPASSTSRVAGVLPVRRPESSIPTGPLKSLPPLPPSLPAKPTAVRPTHSPTRPRFSTMDREEPSHHIERDREVEEREREREREPERNIVREQRSSITLKESPVLSTVPLVRPPFHPSHVRPFGPGAFRGRGALAGVPSGPRTTWTPPRGPRGMGGPFRGGGMGGRGISSMPASGIAPRAPRMMVPAGEERERIDTRLPPPTRSEGRDISESPRGAFRGRGGLFRGRAR
ncbi:PHD Zn-finger proteins [Phaffia rhodozyma]|uniref:PHD Zn-finger proteins n=1 Tax=Phaffia rhodozyma TaxID=264483 RepID=A0A0F7SZ72_PHARH|nr:PHD Zn-finger proteins [Phaffia rhodozyma]